MKRMLQKDRAAHASVRIMLAKTGNVCSRPSSADSIVSLWTVTHTFHTHTYLSLESNIKIISSRYKDAYWLGKEGGYPPRLRSRRRRGAASNKINRLR